MATLGRFCFLVPGLKRGFTSQVRTPLIKFRHGVREKQVTSQSIRVQMSHPPVELMSLIKRPIISQEEIDAINSGGASLLDAKYAPKLKVEKKDKKK